MEAVVNGPFGRVTLGAAPLTIGGTSDNQLVLADASISSHHAEIRPQGQDYVLIDLGSANGTFLNERRLDPYAPGLLHAEDTVRIGDTRFTYEVAGVSETEPTGYVGSHQQGEPAYSPAVDLPPLVMVPTNQQPIRQLLPTQMRLLPLTDQMPNRQRIHHLHHLLLALNQPSICRVLPTLAHPFPRQRNHVGARDSGSCWGLSVRSW